MNRTALAVAVLGLVAGCERESPKPTAASGSPTTAAASVAPSASAAPAEKPAPWYVGSWSGTYEAQHYLVETRKGEGAREWQSDDGGKHTGDGKLALEVSDDGTISGTATGPLGELVASGEVDEDSFRVRLRAAQPSETAFHGFFLAKRSGDSVKGRLQASSGDSLTVRDAPLELTKAKK